MAEKNCTGVSRFILIGLSDRSDIQHTFFVLFLIIYVITLLWNFGIIMLIRTDSRLHTPMYFFLCNLSVVDICYSSVVTPKMLMNFLSNSKDISYIGCFVQVFFYVAWGCIEFFLLSTMAYDRYVAICNPLLYSAIMSHKTCVPLVAVSYFIGFTNALITVCFIARLSYCGSNIIRHFFCDSPPLLALSSSDSSHAKIIICILASFTSIGSLSIILFSYVHILTTILRIHSTKGRLKAFNTCTSHLMSVTVFYGTVIFTYLRPNTSYLPEQDQVASVFYTVVIPVLNPLIYSMRNKEVKNAMTRLVRGKVFSR